MPNNTQLGVNQLYTKFFFVTLKHDDETTHAKVRAAGSALARSFFNDFDANGDCDPKSLETIQFLVHDRVRSCPDGMLSASYVAQVNAKYRPRLDEAETELRRRVEKLAAVRALDGAIRVPRYTSAEMDAFAYRHAVLRTSGRTMTNAIIIPISKTDEWWKMTTLERHAYFYPHTISPVLREGTKVKGHALAAEAGISRIFRRLYHNPDGYHRPKEYDFIAYFECANEHLAVFDEIRTAL